MPFIHGIDKSIFTTISSSVFSYLDGLLYRSPFSECKVTLKMLVNGQGDAYFQNCPVSRGCEDQGWNMQCPMYDQWSKQSVTNQSCYGNIDQNFASPSMQCYKNVPLVPYSTVQYYPVPVPKVYPQVVNYVPQVSLLPNVPCRQQQDWNYDSMCFNVDGEPCQYTEVIDLEDMM